MFRDNIEEMENFFYFYYSKKKFDYVAKLGVHHRCEEPCDINHPYYWSNIPFPHNLSHKEDKNAIGAFGCSITYGFKIPETDSWPALLQKKINRNVLNFGVVGGSVDSIYLNLVCSSKEYHFKKIIILFPDLDRKIARIFYNGNWFKWQVVPVVGPKTWDNLLPHPIGKKLHLNNEIFRLRGQKILKSIIRDEKQKYSKTIIRKIVNFCRKKFKNFYLSSWSNETYKYLLEHYPKDTYNFYDMAGPKTSDGGHPTFFQNNKFVNNFISNSKISQ